MKIAIVIPVYNEQSRVENVVVDIMNYKLPIIIVNDGSLDGSEMKLERLSRKYKNLVVLEHKINLGKGSALKTGCEYAFSNDFDAVILMDADGQHVGEDLNKFVKKLKDGYEVVLGSRNLGLGVPLDRYLGNKFASVLVGVMFGIYVSDLICGYRALTRKAYKQIKWISTGYGVEVECVVRIKEKNLKYCEVPVETIYYDGFKGVSIFDALGILGNLVLWRISGKRV